MERLVRLKERFLSSPADQARSNPQDSVLVFCLQHLSRRYPICSSLQGRTDIVAGSLSCRLLLIHDHSQTAMDYYRHYHHDAGGGSGGATAFESSSLPLPRETRITTPASTTRGVLPATTTHQRQQPVRAGRELRSAQSSPVSTAYTVPAVLPSGYHSQAGSVQRAIQSSATWTSSSGEADLLDDADEVGDDRCWFVQEYNRIAAQVRPLCHPYSYTLVRSSADVR